MGYMRHHAIVVTDGGYGDHIELAEEAATAHGCAVSPIVKSPTNGYRSFLVATDGSKEGWPESDTGDERRAAFLAWLETTRYEDGSCPLRWVEVQYGDDEGVTKVVSDSDMHRRPISAGA